MPLESSTEEKEPVGGEQPNTGSDSVSDAKEPAAESSNADDKSDAKEQPPKSLLEAVKSAIAPKSKAEESSTSKDGGSEKPEATKPEGEGDDGEGEEQPPFHKHPRWQQMLSRVDELTPKAQRYDEMVGMMQKSQLTVEEVNTGFNIMALMKADPGKAYEALKPFVEALEKAVGKILPDDLKDRVEKGHLSEEDAQEIVRARTQAAQATQTAERTQREVQLRDQQNAHNSMVGEVSKWEADWKKSDPDYPKKLKLVEDKIVVLHTRKGQPKSPQEAVALAKEALRLVNEDIAAIVPRKPPIKPATGGSSVKTTPQPKNLREAIEIAAKKGRAA